jgi:hypothetical protein
MWRGTLTGAPTVASRGVPARRRIAAAVVCLAAALAPGVAVAQSGAGDEQYSDPFSAPSQGAPKPKAQPAPAPATPHQQVPSQQQAQPQTGTSAPSQTAAAPAPTAAGGELPRTGVNLVPIAVAGVALVAVGLALRRRAGHAGD